MENRIYYGEYSLKHWIDMILKKKITLPEYQRSFVWSDKAVKRFIKSLKDKQFIPPVTIAHYKIENEDDETNLILDGQQRLTSLLLAAIDFCPDKNKFDKLDDVTRSEDDSEEDDSEEDDDSEKSKPIKWTFNQLLKFGNDIESIREQVKKSDKYYSLKIEDKIDNDFLDNTFLGFSYIVPDSEKKDEVQKSFSKTFREINYFGKSLSAQESRRSLYFMNDKYKDFLDGKIENDDVLSSLSITENMQSNKIDFVRYLAILSQYKAQGFAGNVLKYYSSYASRESFYADYVSFIVGIEQESHEDKFDGFEMDKTFPNECWKERFKVLKTIIAELKEKLKSSKDKAKSDFDSWIDADYYLFGLIYYVLFEDKKITLTDSLIDELKSKINVIRQDKLSSYSKSPNRLGYLRERLNDSIQIYAKYTE